MFRKILNRTCMPVFWICSNAMRYIFIAVWYLQLFQINIAHVHPQSSRLRILFIFNKQRISMQGLVVHARAMARAN